MGRQAELRFGWGVGRLAELNGFVVGLYIGRIEVLLIYIVISVGGRLVVGCKYFLNNVKKSLQVRSI